MIGVIALDKLTFATNIRFLKIYLARMSAESVTRLLAICKGFRIVGVYTDSAELREIWEIRV